MEVFPESLDRLMEEFRKLPTIGKKTAQRLALHLVNQDPQVLEAFARAILDVKDKAHPCKICGNITEGEICPICASPKRRKDLICVVEDVQNLLAIERGGSYFGLYHVLRALLSPMDDMGPGQIGVEDLLKRIREAKDEGRPIKEVILAISPTVEGETTMLFLADLLKQEDIRVTRIASGIPVGGSLEYYDELTLSKAMEDRRELD